MSTIFETYQCVTTFQSQPLFSKWHKSRPRIAMVTNNGVVSIFNDEGKRIKAGSISRTHNCTALDWHPTLPILVTGWKDGSIVIFNEKSKKGVNVIKDNPHNDSEYPNISLIKWNEEGTRFVTGDLEGAFCIWEFQAPDEEEYERAGNEEEHDDEDEIDVYGKIILLEVHESKNGRITDCHFTEIAIDDSIIKDKVPKDQKKIEKEIFYIFSNEKSQIFIADETDNLKHLFSLDEKIKVFLFMKSKKKLIFITDDGSLHMYQINESMLVSRLIKSKINCCRNSDSSNLQGVILGENMIATCSNEKCIRIWNTETEDNYPIRSSNYFLESPIVSISFNPLKRVMAGITQKGKILFWQFLGSLRNPKKTENGGGENDWECVSQYDTKKQISFPSKFNNGEDKGNIGSRKGYKNEILRFGPGEEFVSFITKESCYILREIELHRKLKGNLLVVQIDSTTISLEGSVPQKKNNYSSQMVERKPIRINTKVSVKKIDLIESNLVVSDGKIIEVYEIAKGIVRLKEEIKLAEGEEIADLAVHEQGIFVGLKGKTIASLSHNQRTLLANSEKNKKDGGKGNKGEIRLYNFSGTKKQQILIQESHGFPELISIQGDQIAVVTNHNYLLLYKMTGRSAKRIGMAYNVFREFMREKNDENSVNSDQPHLQQQQQQRQWQVSSMKMNCNGTSISMLIKELKFGVAQSSSKFIVYDVERNKNIYYDFANPINFKPKDKRRVKYGNFQVPVPVNHFWDEIEPRLLVLESKKTYNIQIPIKKTNEILKRNDLIGLKSTETPGTPIGSPGTSSISLKEGIKKENNNKGGGLEVTSVFLTEFDGIKVHDSFRLDGNKYNSLVGSYIPNLYYTKKIDSNKSTRDTRGGADGAIGIVERKPMRDFEGLNIKDNNTRNALINFAFYLTSNNLEEAYKSVKLITDKEIWKNMAKMCVKNKKIDVASLCLSNMEDAIGSKLFREALNDVEKLEKSKSTMENDEKIEKEKLAAVGVLAIRLGMIKEAEELFNESKRYDLLCKLYISIGSFPNAIKIAEKSDRINLANIHYQYAKHLEDIGRYKEAIKHYEKSDTHREEVPRMFMETNNVALLQSYVSFSKDPALHQYWGKYCEQKKDISSAIKFYIRARDFFSLVRIKCVYGHLKEAAEIAKKSNSKKSCFYVAKQLESNGQSDEAIKLYKLAGRYGQAIRLAQKINAKGGKSKVNRVQEVFDMAIESDELNLMLAAAEWFEKIGEMHKAVMLYKIGGFISKAIEYCFKEKLFDQLLQITSNLPDDTDPIILKRCGDYFLQNELVEKALFMYIKAGDFPSAIKMFENNRLKLTKEVADKIKIPRSKDKKKQQERNDILMRIGIIAEKQELYKVASKKFLQAGDKVRAMQGIIRSGDTRMIIRFAKESKKKPLFVLAANYLQTLNWSQDFAIMKTIINFYKKAQAFMHLSKFFVGCSRVEIDEFREYQKARDALKEAYKYMAMVKPVDNVKIQQVKERLLYVEQFLKLKQQTTLDMFEAKRMLSKMEEYSSNGQGDEPVRIGDIYSLIIEYLYEQGDKKQCYQLIQEMYDKDITVSYYLDQDTIVKDIYSSLGKNINNAGVGIGDSIDQSFEEEPVDDFNNTMGETKNDEEFGGVDEFGGL